MITAGWIMFAHEQRLHQPCAPCGTSHTRMITYHITSPKEIRKSILKGSRYDIGDTAKTEEWVTPTSLPHELVFFAYEIVCIWDETWEAVDIDGHFFVQYHFLFWSAELVYITTNHFEEYYPGAINLNNKKCHYPSIVQQFWKSCFFMCSNLLGISETLVFGIGVISNDSL